MDDEKWFDNGIVYGYIDSDGIEHVVGEYGSDESFGKYDTEVMNGHGYYDSNGKYVRPAYNPED